MVFGDKPNQPYKVVEKPEDLEGTGLRRRDLLRFAGAAGSSIVLGPSLAGCMGASDSESGGSAPEEIVIGRAGGPDTLHPHKTTQPYASSTMLQLYDPLVHMDFDGNLHPGVGKEWQFKNDGKQMVIELNDGITFHNGNSLTADDVVYTYNKLKDSIQGWAIGPMKNVEKADDTTVRFNFEETFSPWKRYSAYAGYYGVLPKGALEDKGDEKFGSNPVGSGPYQFDSWTQGTSLTLTKYDDWETPTYPEVESPETRPKKLTWRVIPEAGPRFQALISGEIDIMLTDIPLKKVSDIKSNESVKLRTSLGNTSRHVQFNMAKPPMDNKNLRRAMTHAINKERIINDVYYGLGKKNWVPLSENVFGWAGDTVKEEIPLQHDPEKARELLKQEGWELDGDVRKRDGEPLELKMYSPNSPTHKRRTAEELRAMFENVGIKINLEFFPMSTAYAQFRKDAEESAHLMPELLAWFDPDVLRFLWHSDNYGASNDSRFEDKKVDKWLNDATQAIDTEERAEIYKQIQLRAMKEYPAAPLLTRMDLGARNKSMKNFKQQPVLKSSIYHDVQFE